LSIALQTFLVIYAEKKIISLSSFHIN